MGGANNGINSSNTNSIFDTEYEVYIYIYNYDFNVISESKVKLFTPISRSNWYSFDMYFKHFDLVVFERHLTWGGDLSSHVRVADYYSILM